MTNATGVRRLLVAAQAILPAVLPALVQAMTLAWVPALQLATAATADAAEPMRLSDRCPPGFAKSAAGTCELRNLYQLYDSLQGRGVGGTRTALPDHRDGFTPREIDLGRYLFFDPALSRDGSLSCASCHHPALGFSDGRGRAVGIGGAPLRRSAPTLWNVAFLQHLFWDARASSLEEQVQGPLYAANEMGSTPAELLARLRGSDDYRRLFREAYPDALPDPLSDASSDALAEAKNTGITAPRVYRALAAFQTSLISLNSRYDRYAHGDHTALSNNEIAGMNVFRSFVARCAECHTPPLFTNQQVAVIGTPEPDGLPLDVGAEATWNSPKMKGGFKVPTLRNIATTAPYMHSGRFLGLREAVAFYNKGRGHAVPENVQLHIHWHIWEPRLRDDELDRLVDFLGALTDEHFMPAIPERVPSGLDPVGASPLDGIGPETRDIRNLRAQTAAASRPVQSATAPQSARRSVQSSNQQSPHASPGESP